MRETSYKAVLYSKSLNRYFVSDALRVDTGLACLFGFENQLEAQFNDLILCSEKFVKEIKEDWWMRDWVHVGNIESTGLKDKNDVEIYEGDIVCNEGFKEKVSWDQFYGWVVSDEAMLGEVNFASIKVIGNIYENPELLETTP